MAYHYFGRFHWNRADCELKMKNQRLRRVMTANDGLRLVDADRYDAFDAVIRNQIFHHPDIRQACKAWYHGRKTIGSANDAAEPIAFLVSQLAYTEAMPYQVQYEDTYYRDILPINTEPPEWAQEVDIEIYDRVGKGRALKDGKAHTPNLVNVGVARAKWALQTGTVAYDWTVQELRASIANKQPLDVTRRDAAIEASERHMNDVGLTGETETNSPGLINSSTVSYANATTGSWTSTAADNILIDINNAIQIVRFQTKAKDWPNTILLAQTIEPYLTRPRSATTDTSVLGWIKANNIARTQGGIDINFVFLPDVLETANHAGTGRRMVVYKKDPRVLSMYQHIPFRFMAPEIKSFHTLIEAEYGYSGVFIKQLPYVAYVDTY